MRKIVVIILLLAARNSIAAPPVTNVVDILPRIDAFCRALGLDVPRLLTVAAVTQWRPYRGPWPPQLHGTAGIRIGAMGFSWDVEHNVVWSYSDLEHASRFLYRVDFEGPTPPKTPECLRAVQQGASVITTNEAIALAERIRGRLAAIGYTTNACGRISVRRPTWRIEDKDILLPIYIIEWAYTAETDTRYMEVEIDGLRRMPSAFFTMQGSLVEAELQGARMP